MNVLRILSIAVTLALTLPLASAHAQQVPPASNGPSGNASLAHGRRPEMLRQITTKISQDTGLRVIADTTLSRQQVVAPDDVATKDNIEDYLTRLAHRVSGDAFAIKIYLPASAENRQFTPDAIAQTARAQMELLGRPAPNTVQIQGKVLSRTEAEPLIRTLGLEPVYVLTTRRAAQFGTFGPGMAGAPSIDASHVMSDLTKQLGVNNISDIPPGTYKVNIPGPDGASHEATVDVENSDGSRKVRVMMTTSDHAPARP